MNTGNTLSAWTKTAWCTHRSLWSNLAPTPCGRSSVCDCTAPSVAGLTQGSSGRSPVARRCAVGYACPFLLTPLSSFKCSHNFPLYSASFSLKCCLFFLCAVLLYVFHLPLQGTKTMWLLTLLPTLASIHLTADTTSIHWRSTGRPCSSHQKSTKNTKTLGGPVSVFIWITFGPNFSLWRIWDDKKTWIKSLDIF